ncbi:MAG: peptidylprolyl isomerase [bacterium]
MNFRCISFLIISSLTTTYITEANTVNRIVAWVNDDIITQAEIDKAVSMLGSGITPEQMDKLRQQVLDKLIEEKMVLQEAKRQQIQPSAAEVEEALDNVKKQFKSIEDFKKAIKSEGLTEDDLRKEYEENLTKKELINSAVWANVQISADELKQIRDDFANQIRVRHILVKSKPEAILILARLDKGEKFEELAKKYSIDPGSKNKGGMIDFFTKEKMVKEFSDVAFALRRIGEISGIVETKFGFHIIQLVEKKELTEEELEEIVNEQEVKLRQAKFNEEFTKWIDKLKEKTYIKIEF